MRRLLTTWITSVAALGLIVVAGCGEDAGQSDRTESSQQDAAGNGEPDEGQSDDGGPEEGERTAPSNQQEIPSDEPELLGKGLAIAEQRAERDGFEVQAFDSSGRERTPVLRRSWQVCFQDPARDTKEGKIIRVGVVRSTETCPEEDASRDQPVLGPDNELPDFTGTSLHVATNAFGSSASVNPRDARSDRQVYIPQNWKVCDQSPAPGTRWDGEPIDFQVVKYGEHCP